jgi:hypothetical protein
VVQLGVYEVPVEAHVVDVASFSEVCWLHVWESKVVNRVEVQFSHQEWINILFKVLFEVRHHVFDQEHYFVRVANHKVTLDQLLGGIVVHVAPIALPDTFYEDDV